MSLTKFIQKRGGWSSHLAYEDDQAAQREPELVGGEG